MNALPSTADVVIVGGGIVGLATGLAVSRRFPKAGVLVIEKELQLGLHQTGRNSGVIHSGIYYSPGSLKAELCQRGAAQLRDYCTEHGIRHATTGKIIVATDEREIPQLDRLAERAAQHGIEFTRLGDRGVHEHEPNAVGVAGLHIPATGIVEYGEVLHSLSNDIERSGGVVSTGTRVRRFESDGRKVVVHTDCGSLTTAFAVNCAGLYSDRVALQSHVDPDARIVPFRGEYFELTPDATGLVNALIYPVPDPDFPFLGVHLTKSLDGGVHAGPNAVLALRREGYHRLAFSPRDAIETLTYPGFLRLARRNLRPGMAEVARSFSKILFTRSVQRLVPAVERRHLRPAAPGVRAQALTRQGALVDDFLMVEHERTLHVCNAPSPAATASLAIGETIAERIKL